MPQPSINQVHVDAILTNASVAYIQSADNFIATKVFPIVPVDKQSNLYFKYTKEDWFRDDATLRADGSEAATSGYGLSTDSYYANVYAVKKAVGDQTMANFDNPLDPMRDAAKFTAQLILNRLENQFVSDFIKTSVWGTDYTGVSGTPSVGTQFKQWSDLANSDPIQDIEFGKAKILSTTGFEANKLVLGYDAYQVLRNHPDIIDRVKYTGRDVPDTQYLAQLFGVDEVLVAKAVKNTATEGQTGSFSFAFGKSALLVYAPANPGLLTPSAGYSFQWRGVSEGLGLTVGTKQYRLEQNAATYIESQIAFANKIVAADLGFYFATCVA
jgi:hypothetical protein